jgi:UDP-3-O-[3-hydroxymyristoyl] glucosamine N-acyltransferase
VHVTADLLSPYRIAEGALIEAGAKIGPDVVVCAGGTVSRNAKLTRTIVWPGAIADGEINNAVVTLDGVVKVG